VISVQIIIIIRRATQHWY